jgi:hypothetical protein
MGVKELRIQWLEEQERLLLSVRTTTNNSPQHREPERGAATATLPNYPDKDDIKILSHHADLIRSRPTNLQIVFMGDSVTRYQYLSLAYYLRHGRWWDPSMPIHVNNLVNAHSFHHPLHPEDDWNEFFLQSNRLLHPMEACDCWRSQNQEIILERRYFYDETRNNRLVYINMNSDAQGRGYYGRLRPEQTFTNEFSQNVGLSFGMNMQQQNDEISDYEGADENSDSSDNLHGLHHHDENNQRQRHPTHIQWEYETWSQVIREHIGRIDFALEITTVAVLNAGIHPHNFDVPETQEDLADALRDISILAIWKTTSYSKQEIQQHDNNDELRIRSSDIDMCRILGHCQNISWTTHLRLELYFDNLHFLEPVYRVFNEDLLESLRALPKNYEKFNRTTILRG